MVQYFNLIKKFKAKFSIQGSCRYRLNCDTATKNSGKKLTEANCWNMEHLFHGKVKVVDKADRRFCLKF